MSSPRVGDRVLENGKEGRVVALRPQDMVDVVFAGRDYPIRRPARSLEVMKSNPAKPKTPVFLAAVLTPESKKQLYRWWSTLPMAPEPLAITKASHMTIKFRPSLEEVALTSIGSEVILQVTGWAADGKIQAVSVEPQGVGSANAIPHVTFSIKDPSVAPKLSNDLFVTAGVRRQQTRGPALKARIGWSDGAEYHFELPEGVQSNPGPRGGLSAAERDSLSQSAFALPGRRWPINDKRHAVIAMQYMLRGFGNKSDYPTILNAISKRYPREDKRNAEIWSFYAKHFGQTSRMVANPGTEIGPLSKLGHISYENAPAYYVVEPRSLKIAGKLTHFEGKWTLPPSPISAVSVRFGDAVEEFMTQGSNWKSRLDPADQRAIFDKVNRSEGSPFASLEDFRAQSSEYMRRFEDFMDAYHQAAPELQSALRETLKRNAPLRRGVIDVRSNPKGDVYDPFKEQLRAQAQGIYETAVRKKLGLGYKTPFVDAKGVRLDSQLSEEDRRDLFHGNKKKSIYGAMGTAVGLQQKHGYLIPGTLEPTDKGRAWAADRFSPENAAHAAANRQDYERTLGLVRKSSYYRVVAEVVNGQKRYVVQPRPLAALVQIPAYRLSEDKAREDASLAESALNKAPADLRARANPRNPAAPGKAKERPPTREEVIARADISPEPSFVDIRKGEKLNELAARFGVPVAVLERYPGLTVDSTDVVGPTNMRLSKADLMSNLYGSRVRHEADRYESPAPTREEAEAGRQRLMKELMDANAARLEADVTALRSKAKAEQQSLRTAAKAKSKKHLELRELLKTPPKTSPKLPIPEEVLRIADRVFKDIRSGDVVLLTRGGQGDQPAKAFLHIPPYQSERPSYEVLANFLNKRQVETALILAGSPEKLFEALRDESIALARRGADIKSLSAALDDLQAEIADRAKQPVLLTAQQKKLQAELDEQDALTEAEATGKIEPFQQEKLNLLRAKAPGKQLVYLRQRYLKGTITPEERAQLQAISKQDEGKSAGQLDAQERLEIARMRKKEQMVAQTSIDSTKPFYDVELVLMLYKPRVDRDGVELKSPNGYPRRQYYAHVLKLDTGEHAYLSDAAALQGAIQKAVEETGFEPFEAEVYTGQREEAPVVDLEQPRLETRYVLYIPRTAVSIAKASMVGAYEVPTVNQAAGIRSPMRDKASNLRGMDHLIPGQKRVSTAAEGRGQIEEWQRVYPSARLAKYFVVTPKGLGPLPDSEGESDSALAKTVGTAVSFASFGKHTQPTTTKSGIDLMDLVRQGARERDAAKKAKSPAPSDRQLLSPVNNWVKYNAREGMFKRLRSGAYDEASNTYVGGVQTQQYEVFYTLNPSLAYLTIQFFNTPGLLPHVTAYTADLSDFLALLPAAQGQESSADGADLVPVKVGRVALLGLSPEEASALNRQEIKPIAGRPEVMGQDSYFSCGATAYYGTPLKKLLAGTGTTTTRASTSVATQLEILEGVYRNATRLSTRAGPVYALPGSRGPAQGSLPILTGTSDPAPAPALPDDADLADMGLDNPRPARAQRPHFRNKRY